MRLTCQRFSCSQPREQHLGTKATPGRRSPPMPEFSDLVPLTEVPAELREQHGVPDVDYQRVWRAIRASIVPCETIGRVLFVRRGNLPVLAKALVERPRRRSTQVAA